MTTLEYLNAASVDAFVAELGFAFEDSPWIARSAASHRPFADVDALHAAMLAVVAAAPTEWQVALIAAHPDLAGRVARAGRLTAVSRSEQASAGLHALAPDEVARFDADNAAYRARFGFPFVMAVKGKTKAEISAAFEHRLGNDAATEFGAALGEIDRIAALRLREILP